MMGLLTRALSKPDKRNWNTLGLTFGGYDTNAGVSVTQTGSLKNTAVFACVRILAETIASLPLNIYEKRPDGGKSNADGHYLQEILHDLTNPETTSFEFRETMMGHLALWGNAYAEIQRTKSGRVMALWQLRPDRMSVERKNGMIVYKYLLPDGTTPHFSPGQIMHLRGLSHDGLVGYSPIALARQAVGLALATEEFGGRFFRNGARPGMVLEHPGLLGEEALERLRDSVYSHHQGLSNAHRLMILEEGMKLETIGIPPNDAQFLETRKFQLSEIARIFRVPPHMLADLERATFSNIEQQNIDFVVHTIRPWLVRWEQAIRRDLFAPNERKRYFAEFVVDGLLRGDVESRYNAYATARQNGWMSANDIRRLENMNPVDGGDVYLIPLNMIPATDAGSTKPQQNDGNRAVRDNFIEKRGKSAAILRQKKIKSFEGVFLDTISRVFRREINDVRGATKKHLQKRGADSFRKWLEDYYNAHRDVWKSSIMPIWRTYAAQIGDSVAAELENEVGDVGSFLDDYAGALASRMTNESKLQLLRLLDDAIAQNEDAARAVNERLDGWSETRSEITAHDETFRAGNAFAKAFYISVGIEYMRWYNIGGSCPYCRALNGKIVGINSVFLSANQPWQPDGTDRPMSIRHDVGHAPAHKGCDCVTLASV